VRRAAVLVCLVLTAGVLILPTPALACTILFPGPTEAELLDRADLVFEGVAVSSRDPSAGAPVTTSGDPIFWTFAVDREVKGPVGALQEVGTPRSGASCGVEFRAGVRYRVFSVNRDGAFLTYLGSGTREAAAPPPTTVTPPFGRPLVRTG
jgi:hypothetical protein